jgi:hypothetical protein
VARRALSCSVQALIVLSALVLAACGGEEAVETPAEEAQPPPAAPAPAAPAEPAGPAPIEGHDWIFHEPAAEAPDRASLAYAQGDTPAALWLHCNRGSGSIEAATDSPVMGVGAIILGAGESRAMYRVTSRAPSDFSGGEYLTAEIPMDDGPLQAFRQSGWINLSVAGQGRDLAAVPATGRPAIERFFSFCAPAPATEAETGPAAESG